MKKYLPFKGIFQRGYWCMKHGRKRCYKKTRFYFSTCSDEENTFYYCYGFSKDYFSDKDLLLGTSTFYVTRLSLIVLFFSLPFFNLLVELVLCFFPSCSIDDSLYCFCWLFECLWWQPRQTSKLYWKFSCLWQAIKEWHDLMQRKKLHCLLNLPTPIRYKNLSSYIEIHVVAVVYLLLWWIFH